MKKTSISDLKKKFVLTDTNLNELDQKELRKNEFIKGIFRHFNNEVTITEVDENNLKNKEIKSPSEIENYNSNQMDID